MNLSEFLDAKEQVENEAFEIKDDQMANWALRKIKQYKEEQDANDAIAEAEISKIEEWLQAVNNDAQGSIDYFRGLLSKYAMEQRENDPEFKSRKLPNGRIRFRKQQPKYEYDDEKLVESLKKNKAFGLIRTKEEPIKADVKKAFDEWKGKLINRETGEILEGVYVNHLEDKFEVMTD